jgi:hypothetical protein
MKTNQHILALLAAGASLYASTGSAFAGTSGSGTAIPGAGVVPSDDPTGQLRTVADDDKVSLSLVMQSLTGKRQSVNVPGNESPHVLVTKGPSFTDIGSNRFSPSGRILASWDEVVSSNLFIVRIRIKSSDGSQFLPTGAMVDGDPVLAWTWNVGLTDPINFQDWVTSVKVTSATARFSYDSGATYRAGSLNFTNSLPTDQWSPAIDNGVLRSTVGDGTNAMLLEYKLLVVPTPGVGVALVGGLGLLSRRRP